MIGILAHPKIARSQPLSDEIAAWLRQHGRQVWCGSNWDEPALADQIGALNLLIVLGGDGSILRATRWAAPAGVPVMSVNLGRLGFLSEAQPNAWHTTLSAVLAGDYRLEERLMILAEVVRQGTEIFSTTALNEIVVGRGSHARVARLALSVDGDPVAEYTADALIIATPTGSTAYALAAGGPILPPELRNLMIVPVAPHLSLDRALVLREEADVRVVVATDDHANLTADGQTHLPLQNEDVVKIRRTPYLAHFVRVNDAGYFYRRLMRGLHLVH